MTERTYYWEHATDESRWLRSGKAADLCDRPLLDAGTVGVIIDDGGDDGLLVLVLDTEGLTVAQARDELAQLGR